MELKNYSEECLNCKCRTCRRTYKLNKNLSACNTWCKMLKDKTSYCSNKIEELEYQVINQYTYKWSRNNY